MKGIICTLVLFSVVNAHSATLTGKVERIPDGDTITVSREVVRFAHVDTPECGQHPYGDLSKEHLMTLINVGDEVVVEYDTRGKYGRLIGIVYKDGLNVNLKMAEDGYAYWYQKYSTDTTYGLAESNALHECKGIVCDVPQRPWDYRHSIPWEVRKNLHCK